MKHTAKLSDILTCTKTNVKNVNHQWVVCRLFALGRCATTSPTLFLPPGRPTTEKAHGIGEKK